MPLKYLILTSLSFIFGVVNAEASPSWLQEAASGCEASIQRLQAADLWIGGAVGLYDHGQILESTSGEAFPGSGKPVDSHSFFEIGSVSKSFTGILLALATIEVADLNVNDPISKFLPEVKNPYVSALTLQQLATHTAGLEDNPQDLSTVEGFDPANPLGNYNETQLLNYLQTVKPVPALIDSGHTGLYLRSYSNTGFAVLGLALTRIYSGMSFDDLVLKKITRHLGMLQTFVQRKGSPRPRLMNQPFGIGKNPVAAMTLDIFAPAGAIVSTLPDMMKFLRANIETGSDQLSRAMKLSQRLGFGWDSLPGDQVIMKNGQTYGFSTLLSFDPISQRGAIELHNMYSILSDWVAALPMTALALRTDQIVKSYSETVFNEIANPVTKSLIASAAGTYAKTAGPDEVKSITLMAQKSNLVISLNGAIVGVVLATQGRPSPFWFFQGAMSLGTLNFSEDAAGDVTSFTLHEVDVYGKPVATYAFAKLRSAFAK